MRKQATARQVAFFQDGFWKACSLKAVAAQLALFWLVMVAVGLSGLSLAVRRMHDSDKSGWMLLLGLIPFIGGIVVLVFTLMPGTPGQNRFG